MAGEQYNASVFQVLPTPCVILLPNAPIFTIVEASDAYLTIVNRTREEAIGRGFFEVFPKNPYETDMDWLNIFDPVMRTKKPCKVTPKKYAFPTNNLATGFDVMYLEVINTPVLDEQGTIKYIIRSMTDVTETVHHEKFYEETQHTARIGSWEVNMAHQKATWSQGLREIYEVPANYVPPFRVLEEFYPDPDALQTFESALINATKDGTVFRITIPAITAKGNERWLTTIGKSDLVNGTCIRIYGVTQDVTESKRQKDLDDLEKKVLQMSVQPDVPLSTILSDYILGVESLYRGMYCSILAVRNNRLINWVAPSLPDSYIAEVHNLAIGEGVGSCGTAAYRKERVIVSEIASDPKWASIKDIALAHDLLACWSHPLINARGKVIAVLGIYYKQEKFPNTDELLIIDRMSTLLNIIVENRQNADRVRESATLMAQVQELACFGNWQFDIESKRTKWSPVLCDIYGIDPTVYTPSYDHYLALIHPDDRKRVDNLVNEAIAARKDIVFEERIVRPDGEVRHLRSWARSVVKDDQQSIKLIGASLDITESKQAEFQLKQLHAQLEQQLKEVEQSEQKYSKLFHLSPQPMWVYDLETYRFLDVNAAAITHYGYTREEFLSMTLADISPPEEATKLLNAVEHAKRNHILFTKGVFVHRKKNGELIKVDRLANFIEFHGRRAGLVLLNDITLKLYYIEAIEAQNNKLKEIAWMQSHTVRAPLARIMGLIDLIQHGPSPEVDQDQLLQAIQESAIELDDVLGDITEKAEQVNLNFM